MAPPIAHKILDASHKPVELRNAENTKNYTLNDHGSAHAQTHWELAAGNEYAQWTATTGETR